MCENKQNLENKKEACKTYIEQTKLLVALASVFLMAPAAFFSLMKGKDGTQVIGENLQTFIIAELLFISSILLGYLVLGSIAGSQDEGKFNVYRPATLWLSRGQILSYILGLLFFVKLIYRIFL